METKDFTMEWIYRDGSTNFPEGPSQGVLGQNFLSWVQGQIPSEGSEDEVPKKLKQNVKLVYNF